MRSKLLLPLCPARAKASAPLRWLAAAQPEAQQSADSRVVARVRLSALSLGLLRVPAAPDLPAIATSRSERRRRSISNFFNPRSEEKTSELQSTDQPVRRV